MATIMPPPPVVSPAPTERPAADDTTRHCYCTYCQPDDETRDLALCGTRKPSGPRTLGAIFIPPNACVVCLDLWRNPCPRCAH